MISIPVHLSFSEACEYMSLSPADFAVLRDAKLIAQTASTYKKSSLEVTRRLLELGATRGWDTPTLAWYADLLFAANIGRTIFLPLYEQVDLSDQVTETWLAMQYADAVLEAFAEGERHCDEIIVTPLASLITQAIGEEKFWSDIPALAESDLAPVISYLEAHGMVLLDHGGAYQRDAGIVYVAMMFTFKLVARPLSAELAALVSEVQGNGKLVGQNSTSSEEQALIKRETLIAVDKLYVSKATEIHTPSDQWQHRAGVLRVNKRTIALQMRVPNKASDAFIDNILDIVRPYLGTFGARVVQLLYEVANDAPYYRNPVITIDTNVFLDRLGLKRDVRGVHRSGNRQRLRDSMNAAHNLEVIGEYSVWENGKYKRKTFRRSVLSIIGASFDAEENANLSTSELHSRGLPESVQVRLNFYDGIRQPNGELGSEYILMPRLPDPQSGKFVKSSFAKTHELLKAYFLFRYRQVRSVNRAIAVTRGTALEKASITNKNSSKATVTLRKALDRLVAEGTLDFYTIPIPTRPTDAFEIVLSEAVVLGYDD